MPKKDMTPEERKAFGEKMKAAREAKKTIKTVEVERQEPEVQADTDINDLQRQLNELKALLFDQQISGNQHQEGLTLGKNANLVGEVERYSTKRELYPDPTPRLRKEPRLQPLAFDYNYELEYDVNTTSYETKTGINMIEPKFSITLNRIVLDDQGEQTNKRYIARKLIFHEDPQAAMAIAKENGLEIESDNEEWFLNEMRYLRVRDWIFGIFWPKPIDEKAKVLDEVIGGQIVQVFTKSSEDSSEIDFGKLGDAKLRS